MRKVFTHFTFAVIVGAVALSGSANRASAQTYPIDCAILLCLSGGWPASAPCARARAEFIRRITPWPVEPPLQIWRCPMGASFEPDSGNDAGLRVYDILFEGKISLPQSVAEGPQRDGSSLGPAVHHLGETGPRRLNDGLALQLVQGRADINISGPEFNFVRSIRVYHVRYARQHKSDRDGDCNRSARVVLGTYGIQGDFTWQPSAPAALPTAHAGLERWGEHCPNIHHRSVFVDWRDYDGNYGFEQVNY